MSFFDDSSLAFLPSGAAGKDGKAYSIKPTDGTGDFTFSRGSNLAATRVGPTGLIEKGRENLLTYSNDFSNAAWTKSAATITANALTSPQGNSNASYLTDNTANNFHGLYAIKNISSVVTCSIFVKYDNKQFVSFLTNNNGASDRYAYFDLVNKTTHNISSGITASIEDVGSGWLRLSVMSVSSANGYYWWNIAASNSTTAYVGDGTGRIGIFGAQLEIGLAATDYIESGATTGKAGLLEDEPRFDYSGGATCPSLLLEPSRTQLVGYSEYFGSGWSLSNISATYNYSISPEGLKNATLMSPTTNDAFLREMSNSFTSGGSYTASIYMKSNSGSSFDLNMRLRESGGGQDLIETKTITTEWQRFEISITATITGNYQFWIGTSGTWSLNEDLLIWGAQLEQGSYPTSYIPNHSGGTITRGADSCTGAGDTTSINSTEGVLYVEAAALANDGTSRMIALSDATSANHIRIYPTTTSNRITIAIKSGTVNQYVYHYDGLSDITETWKVAVKYKANDFATFVNGTKVHSSTSGITPVGMNELQYNGGASANPFYGNVKQTLVFPSALSDADCITLTT